MRQMNKQSIIIHWFRQDLRLADNPALYQACQQGTVLPVYILDDAPAAKCALGAASRVWLHYSLHALNRSLNNHLCCYKGNALELLLALTRRYAVTSVYYNACYEPWRRTQDAAITQALQAQNIQVVKKSGALLWNPEQVTKQDGTPYKVFTPFYEKGCLKADAPRTPLPTPARMNLLHDTQAHAINNLELLPSHNWHKQLTQHWQIGEEGAHARLHDFIQQAIGTYENGRNFPVHKCVSYLSPHLRFGEISSHALWHVACSHNPSAQYNAFCRQLGWREFAYHLLYYNPNMQQKNLQNKFDAFVWQEDVQLLTAWQQGNTGIPFVDAGMRELWHTGYMHNRLRMVVGSFLVKNLLLHWRSGEQWFWDCLFDADVANNSAGWQWVAGCGADAAPYFRIFNPVTQGQKFDPTGEYTRRFVPELSALPLKYLFAPWRAPVDVLAQSGVLLGENYPQPIVDIAASRKRALVAFASLIDK